MVWMLQFPAQASASCQSTPAHYLWRGYRDPVDQISAPLVQFVNMHLNIFFILWMLQFPAQASASWYCTPAYYLWRETLIHLSNIHCSVCTIYKMHLKSFVCVMDVAIPMQAIASCRSTPAHNLWRDTHIQFHLQHYWANFNQTWHNSSLDRGESILCKWRAKGRK